MSFKIGDVSIGEENPPFVIAEMSGNHNKSIDRAMKILELAHACGASAIKLQTFTPETITLKVKNDNFKINDKDSLWTGEYLFDLYEKAHTPWEWHEPLFKRAKELGLICFSTPFDETAVDFLEKLDSPAYKIASFENNHLPLIEKAASTGKPLIISTGMANLGEIEEAVNVARKSGCEKLILLKCTSSYPASPLNTNLLTIPHLKNIFNTEVGLSDHTKGIGASVGAVALGATVIEKHFTTSRKEGGVDSEFSLEPDEFASLVKESNTCWSALGSIKYGRTKSEEKSLIFRRSIFVAEDISKGEKFTKKNIRIVRPGNGASPKLYSKLIGTSAVRSFTKGEPLILWEK